MAGSDVVEAMRLALKPFNIQHLALPQARKDSIQINGLAHTGVVRLHANPEW